MRLAGLLALALAAGVDGACRTPEARERDRWSDLDERAFDEPYHEFGRDEFGGDERAGREWFTASVFAVDRRAAPGDGVSDGYGLALGGGYDLAGDPLRLAFEAELGWSVHDTSWDPVDSDATDDIGLFYGSMGARLWWRPEPRERFSPYLRAGGFGRWLWEPDSASDEGYANRPTTVHQTVYGVYYGGGLQFRFAPGSYFGPFALFLQGLGEDSGFDELFVGIGSTFRL